MQNKKKPINGLIILTIIAATLWYGGSINKNQYLNKQLEALGRGGQYSQDEEGINTFAADRVGYIQPRVIDGFDEQPLENALVVIPETGESYLTDKEGYTPKITINIIYQPHFEKIHPKNWGEITLIIYKEGYVEYILLNANVWENYDRKGPDILLFPKKDEYLDQPMPIIESPNQMWINSLVEKYRPKTP